MPQVPKQVSLPFAAVTGASETDGANLQYSYRVDRLDAPVRYRVEVAGTQSPWYTVTLVKQVKLASIELKMIPPSYTGLPLQSITLLPEEIAKRPVSAAQGSRIEFAISVDVPVSGAMLQCGDASPTLMKEAAAHQRFESSFTLSNDTAVSVLITDGAKQIIAKLPQDALVIHCIKDTPPQITMRWPTQDLSVAPDAPLKVSALLRDDYGIASARLLISISELMEQPLTVAHEATFAPAAGVKEAVTFEFALQVPSSQRVNGNSIRVQIEATDNRMLGSDSATEAGPQTTHSPIFQIKFEDPAVIAKQQKEKSDKLHDALLALLKQQEELHAKTTPLQLQQPAQFAAANSQLAAIAAGQSDLRSAMQSMADTFPFGLDDRKVQKTLLMLTVDPAKEAVDLAGSLRDEPVPDARLHLKRDLETRQRRIITTLQSLLASLSAAPEPVTQPTQHPHDDLLSRSDKFKKLDEALKQFMKEQQRILDQTAALAKKPVDNFDDARQKEAGRSDDGAGKA